MSQIENNAPSDVSKILLATKADLNYERVVTLEEGEALAKKHGMPYMEVSAKSGVNVKEGFELLVKEIHKKFESKNEDLPAMSKKEITIGKKEVEGSRKSCSC